jgi:hypothetical protein
MVDRGEIFMKRISWVILLFAIISVASVAHAKRLHPERWYQDRWCEAYGGRTEVAMQDETRCDCLTDTHAVEFDFGDKWAESIGQALYYSLQTRKRAGIVLIIESVKDRKYLDRVNRIIDKFDLPIDVWTARP